MKLLRSFFLALTAISTVHAFKWRLKDTLALGHVLRFTEHYMFATENGPPMLEQGAAYIDMDVNILVYTKTNETAHIAYAIFAASEKYHNISLNGLCDNTATKLNPWATNVSYLRCLYHLERDKHAVLSHGRHIISELTDTVHFETKIAHTTNRFNIWRNK